MTIRLIDGGWDEEMTRAVIEDSSELRIICPFIKEGAIQRLLQHQPKNIQVITRFNLADFAEGVSDIKALRKLLDARAKVRGVRNLHAKLYLFGGSQVIITSCNLTEAALRRNHEFGMMAKDGAIVGECLTYFEDLWNRAGDDLQYGQLAIWDETVLDYRLRGGRPRVTSNLGDYGSIAGLQAAPLSTVPLVVAEASQAFVKLMGKGNGRVGLSTSTIDEVCEAECHWAVCYPANRRPRGVKDNAVIFMGRFTRDQDIRVFGRAIGNAYVRGRDDATPADIERRAWKEKWSRYIRVHNAEFVAGTLEQGVSLNLLMDTLGANSFASTQRNAAHGQGNTNPRRAYSQQAAVQLSPEGLSWLSAQLEALFQAHGKVSEDELKNLEWPDPSTLPPPSQ